MLIAPGKYFSKFEVATVIKYYEGCETTAGTKAFAETEFHCLTDQLLQEEDYIISADK